MRHIPAQSGMADDRILLVVERHPRSILHHERLRLPEQSQPRLRIETVTREGQPAVDLRVAVEGQVVAILVGDPIAVQQYIQEIAGVGVVLRPAPDAARHLTATACLHLERGLVDAFQLDFDPHRSEFLLHAFRQSPVDRARVDEPEAGLEPVRQARLAQQRPGPLRGILVGR